MFFKIKIQKNINTLNRPHTYISPQNALVRLLTKPEVERARDAFRKLDTDMDGRITKATAHEALDR